jgi:hypothetical protein
MRLATTNQDGRIEISQNHMPQKLTKEIIDAAIFGFEAKKRQIDAQIAELRAMLPGGRTNSESADAPEAGPRKRKRFSADARRRMKEAQQRRWAKVRGEAEPVQTAATEAPKRKRRKMSAAGKQAIADATRSRWEAFRATKAQQEKAGRKATRKKGPIARKKAATKKTAAAPVTAQTS